MASQWHKSVLYGRCNVIFPDFAFITYSVYFQPQLQSSFYFSPCSLDSHSRFNIIFSVFSMNFYVGKCSAMLVFDCPNREFSTEISEYQYQSRSLHSSSGHQPPVVGHCIIHISYYARKSHGYPAL